MSSAFQVLCEGNLPSINHEFKDGIVKRTGFRPHARSTVWKDVGSMSGGSEIAAHTQRNDASRACSNNSLQVTGIFQDIEY